MPSGASTPPAGTPRVRGGHPQHREPGGGWGERATGRTPVVGLRSGGPGDSPRPGPRQEYLDAFDDDAFSTGATARAAPTAAAASAGRPGGRAPDREADASAEQGGRRVAGPPRVGDVPGPRVSPDPDAEGPLVEEEPDPEPQRAKAKGRTFTGVAAAAVTTVLAVVVAGQVTGHDQLQENGVATADDGESARDALPPTPAPSPSQAARPATYAEKISRVRPLDPDLHGPGDFRTVAGSKEGTGTGEVVRYRVDVEKELPLDGELFAEAVHHTLNDDRSWAHDGARSFERVESDDADFVITLASPGTTGVWCAKSGLDTTVRNVSCDSASTERIMINAWRWAQGSETFGEDRVRAYREMLINHEVGHRLGLGHRGCETDGALAPVMMQQTKTLTTGDATCRPNPWPHPRREQ